MLKMTFIIDPGWAKHSLPLTPEAIRPGKAAIMGAMGLADDAAFARLKTILKSNKTPLVGSGPKVDTKYSLGK
jgi:hypothetical protein